MFLVYGNISLKKNQIKEFEDCKEIQDLLSRGYVELVNDSAIKAPYKRGRNKKAE